MTDGHVDRPGAGLTGGRGDRELARHPNEREIEMGKGKKVGDAVANAVLRVVDAPHTARAAMARHDREVYAYGKRLPRKDR